MGKSKAGKLLEQFSKLRGINEEEEPKLGPDGKPIEPKVEAEGDHAEPELGPDGKPVEPKVEDATLNDVGELPKAAMEKVKEAFAGDEKKTADAVDAIKKISESKHPAAKKFMEALDDMTSAVDVKKMKDGQVCEDADAEYLAVFEPEKWAHLSEKFSGKKPVPPVKK